MLFYHGNRIQKPGYFRFSGPVTAKSNIALNNATVRDLWHGHTFQLSDIQFENTEPLVFQLGDGELLPLADHAYAISVTQKGVSVSARTEKDLIDGFVTLLDLIQISEEGDALRIPCGELRETPSISNRMIHYCVFHSCELWQLERFVKFCGALKYTHIVLEFWGMYQYKCLKALSWREGFTKEQLRPILQMAKDLGLEIIPMLNHWGHASGARVSTGKHVILNQEPSLQYLFSEDGWCWNFRNPKTRRLLGEMRRELCELCGDGQYFHIGCDEAYGFDFSRESMDGICAYINETARELRSLGRRTIMWGDMILFRRGTYKTDGGYDANCPSEECEAYMQKTLDKDILIADWQYNVKSAPVETALTLKEAGFDVILCPWDTREAVESCGSTVVENGLYGLLHTTWHTLPRGMYHVSGAAVQGWNGPGNYVGNYQDLQRSTAALLRKVYHSPDYEKAGWKLQEVEP